MKRKVIILTSLIMAFLCAFWLVTDYIDSARVRNGIKPLFTIKIVNDTGDKVTYWGMFYKVIGYPSVSPKEPLKNNIAFKKGSWFLKFELDISEETNKKIIEIIDKTLLEDISTAQALQHFFTDDKFKYYYPSIKSEYVVVVFEDGSEITVEKALKEGIISIDDLDYWKINYTKR